jgi:hypothetical protein
MSGHTLGTAVLKAPKLSTSRLGFCMALALFLLLRPARGQDLNTLSKVFYCTGVLSAAGEDTQTATAFRRSATAACRITSEVRATLPALPATRDAEQCRREYVDMRVQVASQQRALW